MPNQSSHLLIIEDDQGRRELTLKESVYSIGRDPKCDICLFTSFASRYHATLIQQVRDDGSYFYQIVDGDGKGRLSACGLFINNRRCDAHDLQDGDYILFGQVRANYYLQS
jgi:pSer/pThr/pTyr-binding forkhead associated (FHA) protein